MIAVVRNHHKTFISLIINIDGIQCTVTRTVSMNIIAHLIFCQGIAICLFILNSHHIHIKITGKVSHPTVDILQRGFQLFHIEIQHVLIRA